MIRRLLAEFNTASAGTMDKRELARRLSISPQMLDTMLGALSASGYIEEVTWSAAEHRPANCHECAISSACLGSSDSSSAQPLWRITEAGRLAAERGD